METRPPFFRIDRKPHQSWINSNQTLAIWTGLPRRRGIGLFPRSFQFIHTFYGRAHVGSLVRHRIHNEVDPHAVGLA